MKRINCLILTLALCLGMASVPASAENVELEFLHFNSESRRETSADIDVFYTLLEEWKTDHPDITLTESGMYQADYAVKMQAQAAAGDVPDIFMLKGSWVSMFVDNDLVYPLNSFIDKLEYKGDYRDGIFKAVDRDGLLYGSPYQHAISSVVFYNKDLWKQAGYEMFPKTWDEFFAANEKFKEMGVYTVSLGNLDKWPFESCILSALGDRFTGTDWTNSIIARDGEARFTDTEFVQALALSQKMATEGFFNPDYNTINNNQAYSYFIDGKAATSIEGHWAVAYYEANMTPEMLDNVGVALLPTVDDGKGMSGSTSGGCGWYIAINSALEGAKLDAAIDLLFTLTGKRFSELMATKYGAAGAIAVEGVDMSSFPSLTQNFIAVTNACTFTPIYDILMEGSVIEVMNSGIQDLLNNTVTPEQLAANIQAEQESL